MVFTIITVYDEENKDYIADVKELDYFGNGKTELEAVEDATKIIIKHVKAKQK